MENNTFDSDIRSLSALLNSAGFSPHDIQSFLLLDSLSDTKQTKISLLQRQRNILLEDLHQRQKILDKLDFLLWNIKQDGT